jgi:hypothetical protein
LIPDETSYKIEENDATKVKRRCRHLAKLRVHFWERWRKEYLTNSREHHRSKSEKRDSNVKKGDVVLVFDENLKRGFWKLGRIESLIVGRDEVVRGAKVRVMTTGNPVYLNRPVQKLYPVELNENGRVRKKERIIKLEMKWMGMITRQKGRKLMKKERRKLMRKTERRVRWKAVSIVIDLGEQLRWMHVGEHKSCLTLTGSKGECVE